MLDLALTIVGILALVLAAGARWLDRAPLSGPMLALGVGVVAGPELLDLVRVPGVDRIGLLHDAARLTLAVSLVAVALRFPAQVLRERARPLLVLVGVVMPLMALASAGLGRLTLGVGAGLALVLGASLAPTDPVLASSVLSGRPAERAVPLRLRQDLSLESGANDGLAMPLVVLALPFATGEGAGAALLESLWGVVGAVLLGWLFGHGAGRLLVAAERRDTVDETHVATYSLVLALTALGLGTLARTDGLLLVFVAGLAFNVCVSGEDRQTEELVDESVHRLLILPLFVLLGVTLPWEQWRHLPLVPTATFVIGVLVLRRLPWVLLLRRALGYRPAEATWLGWFGPIGVAAVYYLTTISMRGVHDPLVYAVGMLTVVTSTVVHGATSMLGVTLLGRRLASDEGADGQDRSRSTAPDTR